jgi:hypothetical protein
LDLGNCLDLTERKYLKMVKVAFFDYAKDNHIFGRPLPENVGGADLLLRHLDCAVLEYLHIQRAKESLRPFDSVRGVFQEGGELYPNAGFREQTHVQVCIRNPACFRGFFMP